jgi:hypothetical protein
VQLSVNGGTTIVVNNPIGDFDQSLSANPGDSYYLAVNAAAANGIDPFLNVPPITIYKNGVVVAVQAWTNGIATGGIPVYWHVYTSPSTGIATQISSVLP